MSNPTFISFDFRDDIVEISSGSNTDSPAKGAGDQVKKTNTKTNAQKHKYKSAHVELLLSTIDTSISGSKARAEVQGTKKGRGPVDQMQKSEMLLTSIRGGGHREAAKQVGMTPW